MAKYTVKFSCGHEQTVELFGKGSDRKRKMEWYAESGLCSECYKKQMEEEREAMPVTVTIRFAPRITEDGEMLFIVAIKGNTKPRKDEIKSLGFCWGEEETVMSIISVAGAELCWQKDYIANEDSLREIKAVAEQFGAEIQFPDNLIEIMGYQVAACMKKDWDEKHEKIAAIPKPNVPATVKGHKWNQKIYGKKGNYTIYPDGIKTAISDEEAAELKKYLADKEEYNKKVGEIK